MADFTAKKAKVMDRRARIRHSIQLEVEAESEGRLQRVKSQLQHVRSVLHINSRTPMGNLLMMEKLLQAFLDSEQRGMASQTPLFSLPSQIPCDKSDNTTKTCHVGIQTDILPPYVLASGENTTGCFDIHTPSKSVEDYFVASHDALQHLVGTHGSLRRELSTVWIYFRYAVIYRQTARTCRTNKHLLRRWSSCSMVFEQHCCWKIYS